MKRNTISTDLIRKNFTNPKITLSVGNMKSDDLLMVRPIIRLYTSGKAYLTQYAGAWWVVNKNYLQKARTFNINQETLNKTAYYKIVFVVDGMTPRNRFYFNHVQLSEGSTTDYHPPEEDIPKSTIQFTTNFYANLYTSTEENYLQVIRPYYNNIDTETITKSKATVLAPHLMNEDYYDSPANIGLEFMNSTDQVIEILR